MSIDTQIMM